MKDKKIIWKDKSTIEVIFILISCIGIFFGAFLFYISSKFTEKVSSLVIILISLFAVYSQIIRKLSLMTKEGIILGNISLKKWNSIRLGLRKFIVWKNIDFIELKNREVKVSKGSWLRTFILVKNKNGKKYECVIYDPEGFVKALKTLGKQKLLSKESRYR